MNREGRKISGLDLEKSDAYGRTALMLAAMGNHPGMVTRTNVSFLSVFKMSQSIYLYLLKSLNFFKLERFEYGLDSDLRPEQDSWHSCNYSIPEVTMPRSLDGRRVSSKSPSNF